MKKLLLAVLMTWSAAANAEVMADGTYGLTGNPAIDTGLVVVNQMIKENKAQEDFNKFWLERKATETKFEKLGDEIGKAREQLAAAREAQLKEKEALRKGMARAKAGARGDKAKEAEIEKKTNERIAELEGAAKDLAAADKQMGADEQLMKQLAKNIQALPANRDDALKQWPQVKSQMVMVNTKVKAGQKTSGEALARAGAAIQKGSSLNANNEVVGAWSLTATVGGSKTELYINGAKYAGKAMGLPKDGKISLRAVIVDARRKQARGYVGKKKAGSISILAADDYQLSYSNGTRTSTWGIEKEVYEWREPELRTNAAIAKPVRKSSKPTVKDDILELTIPADTASETIRLYVNGSIEWKGPSVDTDTEGVSIELKLMPAK